MSLEDSFAELEDLDLPRGVVKAANQYAAKAVPLSDWIATARLSAFPEMVMRSAQTVYKGAFDAFVAGAKWRHYEWKENDFT